jgi:hypothetical protein
VHIIRLHRNISGYDKHVINIKFLSQSLMRIEKKEVFFCTKFVSNPYLF